MSTAAAAGMVAALGLANATGRVAWGFVSDRLGRLTSLSVMFLVTAVLMFAMPNLASKKSTLIPAAVLIGICFGGYLGTFPSLSADAFGTRNAAVNYALMFSAFSLSGLIGPRVGAILGQGPGGYPQAFMVAGVIATAGLVLVVSMGIADVRRPTG